MSSRIFLIFAVLLLPFLADTAWKYWKDYQWRHSSALVLYGFRYMDYTRDLFVQPEEEPLCSEDMIRIPMHGSLGYCVDLEYQKKSGRIQFSVFNTSASFFFPGKIHAYFRISDLTQENELRSFLQLHEEELTSAEFQEKIRIFQAGHRDKLEVLGNGDFRLGLQKENIFEIIKSGKDPEVEWQKRYPPKSL